MSGTNNKPPSFAMGRLMGELKKIGPNEEQEANEKQLSFVDKTGMKRLTLEVNEVIAGAKKNSNKTDTTVKSPGNTDTDDSLFLFDYDVLAEIKLKFSTESSPSNVIFSRAYMEDWDAIERADKESSADVKNQNKSVKHHSKLLKQLNLLGFSYSLDQHTSEGKQSELSFDLLESFDIQQYQPVHGHKHGLGKVTTSRNWRSFQISDDSSDDEKENSEEINSVMDQDRIITYMGTRKFDFGYSPERDDKEFLATNFKQRFSRGKMRKYWRQRYRLFSRLSNGVLMDYDGWFSVTPEEMARHVADRVVTNGLKKNCVILDAFTVGGNAIQFAKAGAYVIAIDMDPIRLRCARRNAEIYEVLDRITFVWGDFFHYAKAMLGSRKDNTSSYGIDAVFLSPPWGGPSYLKFKNFDLETNMQPDGVAVFRLARQISPNIVFFVPRNTRVDQLISLAGPGGNVEIEQPILNGKVKAIHAYYGDLVAK